MTTGIIGLHHGDQVAIAHPDLPEDAHATGTYIGYAGGPTAQVRLDGTGAFVHVPRSWIARP